MKAYFQPIFWTFSTLFKGLGITIRHFWQAKYKHKPVHVMYKDYQVEQFGIVTVEYPKEAIPIPDVGRNRLHNEISDCIVCDKCAVICPVDCITIEAIKSPEPIGETSDGTVKRLHAAVFDIDMAKCCFCGLCTTVCPTECLTMTKVYDYSEFDIRNLNYHFSNLTPEQALEKKALYDQFVAEKEALLKAKQEAATAQETGIVNPTEDAQTAQKSKPVFKPIIKPPQTVSPTENENNKEALKEASKPKPVFKPVIKPPKKDE